MDTTQHSPRLEQARRAELARALKRLQLGADPQQIAEEMSRRLMAKLLHAASAGVDGSRG